tara:strand:+ start:194 stop:580 length:387 start_codon:yes stop_codon:yes gene_type:complete
MRILLTTLALFILGCNSTPAHYYSLKLEPIELHGPKTAQNLSPNISKLTVDQRSSIEKKIKTFKRLIELLNEFEKEIKQKQATAETFSFALSDDDLMSLDASKLLLQYLDEARDNAQSNINALEELLK